MSKITSVGRKEIRKSKLNRSCSGCGWSIFKGESYAYTTRYLDGWKSFYHCMNCDKIISRPDLMDICLGEEDSASLDPGGVALWLSDFVSGGFDVAGAACDISKKYNVSFYYVMDLLKD